MITQRFGIFALLGLSTLLIVSGPADAQKTATWGSVFRTARYECRLMNPTSTDATNIEVYVPLPRESPRQEIHYLHTTKTGLRSVTTDVHGQRLALYCFDRLRAGAWVEVGFVVGVTLQNLRWISPEIPVAPGGPVLTPEERKRYLAPLANYSMDTPLMRNTAAELTRDAGNDHEKVERIHDHIISKIRYVRDGRWDPAAEVLARGTGSCSEYNYVLSGLCRLAGLPTRYVGGSTNGFRPLPATDTIFHRWTEVFITGLGWFPVDCSRDANPLRGKRSHYGRLYTDALVWCCQAGGSRDPLGWEYRAEHHVKGEDPGLRDNHRTRWFTYVPEEKVKAAWCWFTEGNGSVPDADPLECALVHWHKAPIKNRVKMIEALARAGRNECLRRAATLPEADDLRATTLRKLCASRKLEAMLRKRGRKIWQLRSWFRSNESRLLPDKKGRFRLEEAAKKRKTIPSTHLPPSRIWANLTTEVVTRLGEIRDSTKRKKIVVIPVVDKTLTGLDDQRGSIHASLKKRLSRELKVSLINEIRFDSFLGEKGPGRGEYWALALNEQARPGSRLPSDLDPDFILVPMCVTEQVGKAGDQVRYLLELKCLEVKACRYFRVLARMDRNNSEHKPREDHDILVTGGDTVLARWEHDLVSRNGYDWPLAGVKDILTSADAAMCNLECCISSRGRPAKKGERCPFYYRARPEMLHCLIRAGIDIVTAANNHGGDYGPESVADTTSWCTKAGLVCAGNGKNPAEAEEPRLACIGRTRVGIIGMDTTMRHFRAASGRPGTNYTSEKEPLESFTEKMQRAGRWADGRCDLLILTIHWGKNWVRETQPIHRKMAHIAFENGVDLILGHSAHRLQGIEIIRGKVVLYDMGNLLFDCKLKAEGRLSALFRLHISKAGVHRVEVIPTLALNGRTVLAGRKEAEYILAEMRSLCTPLNTNLVTGKDEKNRPMGVIENPEPVTIPRKRPDPALACATFPARRDYSPASTPAALIRAIPLDVGKAPPPIAMAPGIEILGHRLSGSARERGMLYITSWWRVTRKVKKNVMLAFRLSTGTKTARRGTPWYTRHDAGDWTVPLHTMKPGMIVEDFYPARLAGLGTGPCDVHAVVMDTSLPEGGRILGEPYFLGTVNIKPRKKK